MVPVGLQISCTKTQALPNLFLFALLADDVDDDDTDVDRICAALRRLVGLCGDDGGEEEENPLEEEGENVARCARSVHRTHHIHCGASTKSRCFVLFSFGSSGYQLGCTVAAVSAKPSKMFYKISQLSGRRTVYKDYELTR